MRFFKAFSHDKHFKNHVALLEHMRVKRNIYLNLSITKTYTVIFLGFVHGIDALEVAKVCRNLGAGRTFAGQEVDMAVGIQLHVEVGDRVQAGKC